MDKRFAETSAHSDHASRTYLAWANSLSRLMRTLGIDGAEGRPLTPTEALRRVYVTDRPDARE